MADTSIGMAKQPGQSSSLQSRLLCAKCGCEPQVKSASGTGMITLTVACHGQEETFMIEKKDLIFTRVCFNEN